MIPGNSSISSRTNEPLGLYPAFLTSASPFPILALPTQPCVPLPFLCALYQSRVCICRGRLIGGLYFSVHVTAEALIWLCSPFPASFFFPLNIYSLNLLSVWGELKFLDGSDGQMDKWLYEQHVRTFCRIDSFRAWMVPIVPLSGMENQILPHCLDTNSWGINRTVWKGYEDSRHTSKEIWGVWDFLSSCLVLREDSKGFPERLSHWYHVLLGRVALSYRVQISSKHIR